MSYNIYHVLSISLLYIILYYILYYTHYIHVYCSVRVTRGDEENSACGMLATKRVKVATQG